MMKSHKLIRECHTTGIIKNQTGFELEFFVTKSNNERVFYAEDDDNEINLIFKYLCQKKKFNKLKFDSTIGVERCGCMYSLEPGSQIEYSSSPSEDITNTVSQLEELFETLDELEKEFNLKFLHVGYLNINNKNNYNKILPKDRYRIMYKYFMNYNKFGREMMFNTSSLQFSFSNINPICAEEITNNILRLKPVLLRISSNSILNTNSNDTYLSYREYIWSKMDQGRCGEPGINVWKKNKFSINAYIEKVISAERFIQVVDGKYQPCIFDKTLDTKIHKFNIEDYKLHNSTIFCDIRLKNYTELRFMDNPGRSLAAGMIVFLDYLVNNPIRLMELVNNLPYELKDVPKITRLLNMNTQKSSVLWSSVLSPLLCNLIELVVIPNSEARFRCYLDILISNIRNK